MVIEQLAIVVTIVQVCFGFIVAQLMLLMNYQMPKLNQTGCHQANGQKYP
jgi:hypothetical protein